MPEDDQGRSTQGQCLPARPSVLSVVVPVYNEADVLSAFHTRLVAVLTGLPVDADILYVDDGSTDATAAVLTTLQQSDARVSVIQLSRNFGKEIAMTAGLDHVRGDAAVIIDADLQDPPSSFRSLSTTGSQATTSCTDAGRRERGNRSSSDSQPTRSIG